MRMTSLSNKLNSVRSLVQTGYLTSSRFSQTNAVSYKTEVKLPACAVRNWICVVSIRAPKASPLEKTALEIGFMQGWPSLHKLN